MFRVEKIADDAGTSGTKRAVSSHFNAVVLTLLKPLVVVCCASAAATLCVGGPQRGRRGTESRSASLQTVRHSHLWQGRYPLSSSVIDFNRDDPRDSGG